jgi:paraquat-inducible protein B|tara:strand:+ start:646 stop:918 length:273 start_codon:yes stop_codon:yes gene_type:complete
MLQTLKSEVDDATQKVEQCEGLVNKLENEIIEWDAQKKLCRRDEELEEIDNLLKDFQNDLTAETEQMYPKLEQNTRKLESSTSAQDVEDF